MGYYMSLAGLGLSPHDVVIKGAIVSFNQCFGSCTGLNNFWRSLSNLTLNVHLPAKPPAYAPAPPENPFCANSNDLYAISQAAPIRRVHINGLFFLFDYCNTGFTSGGFIADSEFTGSTVVNGSQQQFLARNRQLDEPIDETRPDSVVLGLGFPTLVPTNGNAAMTVASAEGMLISGVLFDAGAVNSPVLLQVGDGHARSDNEATDPSVLSDVFFRVGGAAAGKVTTALVVNSNNVILDDIWSWRADHGNGVGWTSNTADTGVIVNGDNATAYGLFVEHYQKFNVIWNGNGGTDIFFQNEMPYDVPSQAAWMEAPGVDGYAAFEVGDNVTSFHGYGMGTYSFFNKGIDIFAANGFEVPATLPAGSLHDIFTLFLDKVHGKGGILNVINNNRGPSTLSNPDVVVAVVSYP